jgi:hypothetical protein
MRVEVDTQDIAALERRVEELGTLLTWIVARSKNGTVNISPTQQQASGSVQVSTKDDGTIRLDWQEVGG